MNTPGDKSPVQRLLDAGVYAPLGYLLRRDEVREDLASAGRKQLAFARSLGQAALKSMGRGARPSNPAPEPVAAPEPVSAPASERVAAPEPEAVSAPEPASVSAPEPVAAPASEPEPELLGYSNMTARELIAHLRDAPAAQAQWVFDRETSGKQRVTVLRAATTRLERDG